MIVVIGDLLLDVYVLSHLQEAEQGQGILLRPGGSAANTAAWLAHLGSEVMFVGCVGEDAVGTMLTTELESHHVITRIEAAEGYETGAVIVELGKGTERTMRSARGANEALDPETIRSAWLREADVVHLTGYSLLSPHGIGILQAAGELARRCSAKLSFDPSSIGVIHRYGGDTLLRVLTESGVDIFLPNRAEAEALTGERQASRAAHALTSHVGLTIVKDAARGAVWRTAKSCGKAATKPLVPLDTTGAGDAFNAGAIKCFIGTGSAESACMEGNLIATRVIQKYGGRPASPNW